MPSAKLHVFGSDNDRIRFGNSAATGSIYFGNSTTNAFMSIGTETAAKGFRLFTENTDRLTITADGKVGIGTQIPAGALDVTSTTNGFLPPRMTTAQRTAIASPVAGLTVYDINTNSLWFYNGTAWTNADYARTLTDVSASRSFNTTFTNTNAYPITVMYTVTSNNGAATSQTITVNGLAAGVCNSFSGVPGSMTFVVPAGGTYSIAAHVGVTVFKWLELR